MQTIFIVMECVSGFQVPLRAFYDPEDAEIFMNNIPPERFVYLDQVNVS